MSNFLSSILGGLSLAAAGLVVVAAYRNGLSNGRAESSVEYDEGYSEGYSNGYDDATEDVEEDTEESLEEEYDQGHIEGFHEGFESAVGTDEALSLAHDYGYQQGYDDGIFHENGDEYAAVSERIAARAAGEMFDSDEDEAPGEDEFGSGDFGTVYISPDAFLKILNMITA